MDPFGRMEQRLERQAGREVRRFTSGCIFSIVFALVAFCLVAGVGVYIFFVAGKAVVQSETTGANATGDAAWNGQTPFMCGGAQNLTISNVTAVLATGPAITAGGACQLTLVNVNITAPVVISAGGAAHVTVQGGVINGSVHSIEAGGGAHVDVVGATVVGAVDRGGGAVVTGVP